MEAGGLQDVTKEFKQETGVPVRVLFALYEGGSGDPADEDDAEAYDEVIGSPRFPIFADGNGKIADRTPITQLTHPEMCALTDEMVILGCHAGHGAYEDALDDIRDHLAL